MCVCEGVSLSVSVCVREREREIERGVGKFPPAIGSGACVPPYVRGGGGRVGKNYIEKSAINVSIT